MTNEARQGNSPNSPNPTAGEPHAACAQSDALRACRCRPLPGIPAQAMFPSAPEIVSAARHFVRDALAHDATGLHEDLVDDVRLIVSELVTNAVRYGTEPGDSVLVLLAVTDTCVRIEVRDPVRRRPRFRAVSQERDRGRGLFIVQALAECWGVADRPFGKAVWAQVAR
ncbi:ATP-binding protein [Streptomyces sp. NPDC059255]|uniref:ATP-binding protein n=1 Tax=Streptomyces sp. NPDC059255 TaxID=3346793 RepID=UPI0036BCBC99